MQFKGTDWIERSKLISTSTVAYVVCVNVVCVCVYMMGDYKVSRLRTL